MRMPTEYEKEQLRIQKWKEFWQNLILAAAFIGFMGFVATLIKM